MEWNCVFKRHLTAEEKELLSSIPSKNNDKAITDRQGIPKLWESSLGKEDSDVIKKLFEEILYDFVAFDFFVMKEDISLRMTKKWSSSFSGCCYVPLKDLLEDKILLYTSCTDKELETHIIYKTEEIYQYIIQY